jgi:hypothetical protein
MFLASRARPVRKSDVTAICEPIVYKMWDHQQLKTLQAFTAYYKDSVALFFYVSVLNNHHSCYSIIDNLLSEISL